MKHISAKEVEELVNSQAVLSIIDVREPNEVAGGMIPGARNIPLGHLLSRSDELDKDQQHILVCASGHRSQLGAFLLRRRGFEVVNMTGGMQVWTGVTE